MGGLSHDDVRELVDGLDAGDLLRLDFEAVVEKALSALRFPDPTVKGRVHIEPNSVRGGGSSALAAGDGPVEGAERGGVPVECVVHVPRPGWEEMECALEQQLSRGGLGWGKGQPCTCVPGQRMAVLRVPLSITVNDVDGAAWVSELVPMVVVPLQQRLDAVAQEFTARASVIRQEAVSLVRQFVTSRMAMLRELDAAHRRLGVELVAAPAAEQIVLRPRALSPERLRERAAAGEELPTLVREAREGVIDTVVGFSRALERQPRTAQRLAELDEEAVRDVLLFVLNANWRGQAAGEVFTGMGKTDISIFEADYRVFMAELKWWNGPKALSEAIDQLAGYVVGRDAAATLIVLDRSRNHTRTKNTIRKAVEEHPLVVSTIGTQQEDPDRYWVKLPQDPCRRLELVVITVDLSMVREVTNSGQA